MAVSSFFNSSISERGSSVASNIGENTYQAEQVENVENYGTVLGNGTKNAILGYATTSGGSGWIETAQMR